MNTRQIDYLNIGLMLLSTVLAFWVPLEQLFVANLVLAPLHYLSELAWLGKRNFFLEKKRESALLLLMVVLAFGSFLAAQVPQTAWGKALMQASAWLPAVLAAWGSYGLSFSLIGFLAAFLMVFKSERLQWLGLGLAVLLALFLEPWLVLFAVFLGTVIHSYVFTGAFILLGALKSNSRPGLASFGVFLLCGASFFVLSGVGAPLGNHPLWAALLGEGGTLPLLVDKMADLVNGGALGGAHIESSEAGAVVMRFLSFMFTYHYLNWFSKTNIIRWHQVGGTAFGLVLGLSALCTGLYFVAPVWSFYLTLLFSVMHNIMEFPLNYRTFAMLGKALAKPPRPA